MAKKLYEEASVQAIANAIRAKNGSTATYKIAEMAGAVQALTGAEDVQWHQCPEAVRNYLANVTYDPSDYSTSQIADYAPAAAVQSNTKPIGKVVDGKTFYNEPPNVLTPFATTHKAGTLKPLDQVRWVNTSQTQNVRDIGGWACDGGTVKYGKIFRGAEPAQADATLLTGEVGIRAELELQGTEGGNSNVLAGKVDYCCPLNGSYWAYYSAILNNKPQAKEALEFAMSCACHGKPVYVHCSAGADRTGTVVCILEGILGVSQSDCDKDYEMTSFTGSGDNCYLRKRCGRTAEETGTVAETGYKQFISGIAALPGATFRDKCVNFVLSCGITAEQINAFRAAMIDGTPETLSPTVSSYTVSRALAGATADNSAASATQYQPYETKIEPADGKVISSVKVTMGGVDITSAVFSGQRTNMRHAVTASLTNCATNNRKKAVIDGEGYGATITAATGCTLDGAAVKIMMGGIDMSATYYSNGKIAIPNVTGDIAITVTAVATAPNYTNLFDASKMYSGQRINSSGQLEANSAWNVSNNISYVAGSTSTVRIKGIGSPTANDGRVVYSTDNGASWYGAVYVKNSTDYAYDAANDIISFTLKTPNPNMFRISFPSTVDINGLIITVNEEIF